MSSLNLGTNPLDLSSSAVAVLALMDYNDGIESSWDDDRKEYTARMIAVPFYNCRERGYIVWDRTSKFAAIFCEHRNSDNIVISTFKYSGLNPPSFNDWLGMLPESVDKWSMWDQSFGHDKQYDAAQWIIKQFESQYPIKALRESASAK